MASSADSGRGRDAARAAAHPAAAASGGSASSAKFVSQNDWADREIKRQTVGLVHLDDFTKIQAHVAAQSRERHGAAASPSASAAAAAASARKRRKKAKAALSFLGNDDDDDDEAQDPASGDAAATATSLKRKQPSATPSPDAGDGEPDPTPVSRAAAGRTAAKAHAVPVSIKKNPHVDTSFLPDREREAREQAERQRLQAAWEAAQEAIKAETIAVTYSFWDGSGHRRVVRCQKGDTIKQFLEKCRAQFESLRAVHVDNLMYIKEDLIIPHHYTFYDFMINQARGKSGPLFDFEVRDDVRLLNDATQETDESHAGKVIERAWYERNKHIFPASRWELFDPKRDYGDYSIKDRR